MTNEEDSEDRWLKENGAIVAERCTIPTMARIKATANVLRLGSDALEAALGKAREMFQECWPTACDAVDEHMTDRFEGLLDEGRIGSKWTVEELRDLADDLDGNPRELWVSLVAKRLLSPTPGQDAPAAVLTALGRERKARMEEQASTRPLPGTAEFVCTPEWRAWMERLAKRGHLLHSMLIYHALEAFAKSIRFEEPPPR